MHYSELPNSHKLCIDDDLLFHDKVCKCAKYAAQGLKAKEPSCVEKVQYLQTRFACKAFCNHLATLQFA